MYTTLLTVSNLKEIVKDLPDDMKVVIPVLTEEDGEECYNHIDRFRLVTTAGILNCNFEKDSDVLCLSSCELVDIAEQIKNHCSADVSVSCEEVLF